MAKKGTIGNAYHYSQKKIDRLINRIDKRTANGKDGENTTPKEHTFTAKGERVWSY